MKRSERLLRQATQDAWMAAVTGSMACASGVWAAVALLHDNGPGGLLGAVGAAVALRLAWWHAAEWRRLRRLAAAETRWETSWKRGAA